MQEEFITQYKSISEMIERCYPQANIALLFSIEDVLNVFSEIAQMHWWSVWSGCFSKYNNLFKLVYFVLDYHIEWQYLHGFIL